MIKIALFVGLGFAFAYLWIERAKLQAVVQNRGTLTKAGTFLDAGESLWDDVRKQF